MSLGIIVFIGCLIAIRPFIKNTVNEVKFTYLDKKNKDRVVIVDYQKPHYVIDNRMRRVRANNNIKENTFHLCESADG